MKKLLLTILLIPFLLLLTACEPGTLVDNTYKTLAVSQNVYDLIFKSLGDAYTEGLLSEEHKDLAIQKGNIYYNAYLKSATLLKMYADTAEENRTEGMKTMLLIATAQAVTEIKSLRKYIETILNTQLDIIDIPIYPELENYMEKQNDL